MYVDKDGYGLINHNGKTQRVHRVSYEYFNGKIPENYQVIHRCDNPRCLEPTHLIVGTNQDNIIDKMQKKRHLFGCAHRLSTLSLDNINFIKSCVYYRGIYTKLGKEFNVSCTTIRNIMIGKSYTQ